MHRESPIPQSLHDDLKNVTLCIDFHFINNVTIFHTISRRIDYRTVSFPLSCSKAQILTELKSVYKKYNARGFRITEIHADKEFEKIEQDVLPIRLRICGVDEHIPEIERSVQTQKNENRATCYAMPYKCMPRLMIRELIKQGNEFLNAFGSDDCIAPGLTPCNIIDNLPHIDYNDLKYEFGQYVRLHLAQQHTNTMHQRTIGAIVLGPRKIQGQYNYMSLETGEQVDGRVVAVLPPTDDVIERVEQLGQQQKQPYRLSRMLKYEWSPGQPISEDDSTVTDDICPTQPVTTTDIVPTPVTQPTLHGNPFAILAEDTDQDDDDDDEDDTSHEPAQGALQNLPTAVSDQGADDNVDFGDQFELQIHDNDDTNNDDGGEHEFEPHSHVDDLEPTSRDDNEYISQPDEETSSAAADSDGTDSDEEQDSTITEERTQEKHLHPLTNTVEANVSPSHQGNGPSYKRSNFEDGPFYNPNFRI